MLKIYGFRLFACFMLLMFYQMTMAQQEVLISEPEIIKEQVTPQDTAALTAYGITHHKSTLGTSISQISGSKLINANETNIINALHSQIAGLTVRSSSGSPGASSAVRLRGFTSFLAENTPLIVLDGMPIDNSEIGRGVGGVDLSNRAIDINAFDIQSATFLKGVSASSLYGVRGSNGVILLTSKKGQKRKPIVNISAGYTSSSYNNLPERQSTYAQGRPINGVLTWRGPETGEGFSWGPAIADLEFDGDEDYPFDNNGRLVATGHGIGDKAIAYDPHRFFTNGSTFDLNASVSGGLKWANYYISAGRSNSTGIIPTSEFLRNTFRFNLTASPIDKLEIGIHTNYILSGGDRTQRGSNIKGVMLGLLRNTPSFDITNGLSSDDAVNNKEAYELEDGNQRSYRDGIYDNPYWSINKNPFTDEVNRLIGSVNLKYQLLDWIDLNYLVGIDRHEDERFSGIGLNPRRDVGSLVERTIKVDHMTSNLFVDMSFSFGDDFKLTGIAGMEYFNYKSDVQSKVGTGFALPDIYEFSNLETITEESLVREKENLGIYSSWDIRFKEIANLNITARNDNSSILASDKSFLSYSAALGIDILELSKIKSNVVSGASVRLAYGKVGNDGGSEFINIISDKLGNTSIGGDGFIDALLFPNFGVNSVELNGLRGNKNLELEETTEIETGFAISILDKYSFDFTFFKSTHENLIVLVPINSSTGFSSTFLNSGDMESKGIELGINASLINQNNLKWNLGAVYSSFTTDVNVIDSNVDNINFTGFTNSFSGLQEGAPFGSIIGQAFKRKENGKVLIGEDGWPLVETGQKLIGDPTPDFTLGLHTSVEFNDFSFGALLDIKSGGDMWCGTCGIMNYFGTSKLSADERDDVVVFEGVQNIGTDENPQYVENTQAVPLTDPNNGVGTYYRTRYGFGGITEMNVHDASWVRLRNISLGYELPPEILDKVFFDAVKFTVTGKNLWLSTDYPGIDPETNLTGTSSGYGIDYFNNPNTKSFSFNVQLTF